VGARSVELAGRFVRRIRRCQRVDRAPCIEREAIARDPCRTRDAQQKTLEPAGSLPKMISSTSSRKARVVTGRGLFDRLVRYVFGWNEKALREQGRVHWSSSIPCLRQSQHDGAQHANQASERSA